MKASMTGPDSDCGDLTQTQAPTNAVQNGVPLGSFAVNKYITLPTYTRLSTKETRVMENIFHLAGFNAGPHGSVKLSNVMKLRKGNVKCW
jgi:hypothetical protein